MRFCQYAVIFLPAFQDFHTRRTQIVNMISYTRMTQLFIRCSFLFLAFFASSRVFSQDGASLYKANCASCHSITKDLTGPALGGFESRGPWGDRENVYAWIKNTSAFMAKDPYTQELKAKFGGVVMTPFPNLSNAEIDAIVDYINKSAASAAAAPAAGAGGAAGAAAADEQDNSLLFGILTLVLAIVAFVLLQVNSNLKKLADDREGIPATEPVPFWRNKAYIAFVTVILFLIGGYLTTKGAINLGRNKDYQPVQPIYFSHKVHAGVNQISCLYCHTGASEGKHANIPSISTCMNCHMAINEYTGDPIYNEDGEEVDGTAEIKKLYEFANFQEGKNAQNWDASQSKPIEWIKIHNLPDHVYFNHSQHVQAGKVACQTCHGEIQKMDEVKQFTDLSMGWCVNCHRETKVEFKQNGFYSIYEKYHQQLKNGELDSTKGVTVEHIGGTECQKCHY